MTAALSSLVRGESGVCVEKNESAKIKASPASSQGKDAPQFWLSTAAIYWNDRI
jgi:hypothetical protein